MKSYKSFALFSALAFASAIFPRPAAAQTTTASPVMVREVPSKPIWLKASVIHFDSNSIVVREQADERMIHAFTYSPKAQQEIQKALNQGGYQSGDKVKIRFLKGQTVALAIHGKPSKPL
ncbi:MAG TPA: hypothetical protein VJW93_14140 [Candidatus Acidoferrales bacterium]|nr:hypothetical protein [Candidatus Acidoferrales bacterium]